MSRTETVTDHRVSTRGCGVFEYFKGSITSYHLELITALLVALKSQTSLASGSKMGQNADLSHEKKTTARNPDRRSLRGRRAGSTGQSCLSTIAAARRVSQSVREGWSVRGGLSQKGSTAALRDRQTDRGTRLSRGLPSRLIHRSYLYLRAGGVPTHGTHTSGTAYTRGTYSRVNTQTNASKHTAWPYNE